MPLADRILNQRNYALNEQTSGFLSDGIPSPNSSRMPGHIFNLTRVSFTFHEPKIFFSFSFKGSLAYQSSFFAFRPLQLPRQGPGHVGDAGRDRTGDVPIPYSLCPGDRHQPCRAGYDRPVHRYTEEAGIGLGVSSVGTGAGVVSCMCVHSMRRVAMEGRLLARRVPP